MTGEGLGMTDERLGMTRELTPHVFFRRLKIFTSLPTGS
jgi:hypothetical protein